MKRVALKLRTLNVAMKIALAQNVYTKMKAEPDLFGAPPVTMIILDTQTKKVVQLQEAATEGKRSDRLDLRAEVKVLEGMLTDLAFYVNTIASGDEAIIVRAGMTVGHKGPRMYPTINPPQNFRASYTQNSEEILLRWERVSNARTYRVQQCADPTGEDADWTDVALTTRSRALITDLTTGEALWFRVLAAGAAGESSWSTAVFKVVP